MPLATFAELRNIPSLHLPGVRRVCLCFGIINWFRVKERDAMQQQMES